MTKKTLFFLISILIVSFAIRFVFLGSNPPSLNWDEVSHGYNAYSILKTGHDEWGQFLPLTNFRAYGDYPTTLYMYLLMPIISVFGLNEITVRLPSAILGALLPLIIFFLTKRLTKKDSVALITAFMIALSPWGVLLSRQVLQATPAIFFMTLGVTLFLSGVEKKPWLVILGTISLGLSAYGYHNTRIFAPLLLFFLLLAFRHTLLKNLKTLIPVIAISLVLFTPVFLALVSAEGRARSSWVGILDQGAINKINESRGASFLPPVLARAVHNKVTYYTKVVIKNYYGYFSPTFLATKGGTHHQFSVKDFGIINPVELPFFYLGLFLLLKHLSRQNKESRILLLWLLAAPLPAVITRDPFQVVRATTMMPAVYLTIAYGLSGFLGQLNTISRESRYKIIALLALAFAYGSYKYYSEFFISYPQKYSQSWQYGYKEAITFVKENYGKYDQIVITKKYGEPHEFVYFYTLFDPAKLINDPHLVRYERTSWYWTDSIDKYTFMNDWEIVERTKDMHRTLLVTSPDNVPEKAKVLNTINFLDGQQAFIIVSLP